MKKTLIRLLYLMTSNQASQKWLLKLDKLISKLRGIGSGAFPESSGEKEAIKFVIENYQKSDYPLTIFDVGANKGQFLQEILDVNQGNDFKVYCFEPQRESFNLLASAFNDLDFVKFENIGFDNEKSKSKLFYDKPGSIFSSKYNRDVSRLSIEFTESEIVEYNTIDEYCKDENISKIDYLKIDVEGNELNVLKGAAQMLADQRIKFISFEFGSTQIDSRTFFKDIYEYLQSHHIVRLYRLTPGGYMVPIEAYDEDLETFFTANYLAVMK